jgi:hypothetical protein
VVSATIVVERQEDGHAYPVQRPVYFVSEVLSESKAHYQPVPKLLYAVLITSWKLRHYFQEYLLMDKRRIHLRSASVRTYTFFTTGFPRFLSIRGARGLQAFDLPLLTNYSNPNYD